MIRRTDFGTLDITPVVKPIQEPRVVVQTTSEFDIFTVSMARKLCVAILILRIYNLIFK